MTKFNIIGRPDGIGNRIEEIILVNAFCIKNKQSANYIWKNKIKARTYDIKFSLNKVKILKNEEQSLPFKTFEDIGENFSQTEILNAAKNIAPNFKIGFENNSKPIGVHIRGTDRIKNNNHPHFMKDKKEFYTFLSKTLEFVNKKCPKNVFLCSDDIEIRDLFIKNLNKNITVVQPISEKNVPEEYIDFFALTLCKEVIMCSKFSSFAITASIIGNIPLVALHYDKEVTERYKAIYHHELDIIPSEQLYIKNTDSSLTSIKNWFKMKIENLLSS
ncbi:hypothetical protein [uncultured Maribacter sp.]|uniref:hypothetical protein n=1 Tax=uncultured Maribacter sp. TaxID=431308 RepID=UPI00262227E5|nr:hypothetical protein [uncultured Maribacter sp.]